MIALFTDFGLQGPYTGQMRAVLYEMAPGVPVIDLFRRRAGRRSQGVAVSARGLSRVVSRADRLAPRRRSRRRRARGRRLFSKPTAGGTSAPATACSSWSGVARVQDARLRDRLEAAAPLRQFSRARPLRPGCGHAGPRRAIAPRPALRRWRMIAARPGRTTSSEMRLRRSFRQRHDWPEGGHAAARRDGFPRGKACSSARGPSATGRPARPSATRTRTALPTSPSIRGAPTATSASRSACPSRSSLERRRVGRGAIVLAPATDERLQMWSVQ